MQQYIPRTNNMEISEEKKEQLKYFIIENFNEQPVNIQQEFKRELQRQDSSSIAPEMSKTINILLSNFFIQLNLKEAKMFEGLENPVNIIEEVLFEYVNSQL